jgi:hypothetical protein
MWVIERVQAAMAEQETGATGEVRVACKPPSKVKAEKQQRAQGRST